jgi:hypothetical protein
MHEEHFLNKISSLGILGYSIEKIAFLLDVPDPESLRQELETPGTAAYNAYHKGKATGEYALDKALYDEATKNADTDANDRLRERIRRERIDGEIEKNFHL